MADQPKPQIKTFAEYYHTAKASIQTVHTGTSNPGGTKNALKAIAGYEQQRQQIQDKRAAEKQATKDKKAEIAAAASKGTEWDTPDANDRAITPAMERMAADYASRYGGTKKHWLDSLASSDPSPETTKPYRRTAAQATAIKQERYNGGQVDPNVWGTGKAASKKAAASKAPVAPPSGVMQGGENLGNNPSHALSEREQIAQKASQANYIGGGAANQPSNGYQEGAGQGVQSKVAPQGANWLVDIMSRPLYGVANAADAVAKAGQKAGFGVGGAGKDHSVGHQLAAAAGALGAAPEAFAEGLTGKKRTDFTKAIENEAKRRGVHDPNSTAEKVITNAGGFIGNMLDDPLNFVPGEAIAKVLKGGKDIVTGERHIANSIKPMKEAEELADRTENAAKVADKLTSEEVKGSQQVTKQVAKDNKISIKIVKEDAKPKVNLENAVASQENRTTEDIMMDLDPRSGDSAVKMRALDELNKKMSVRSAGDADPIVANSIHEAAVASAVTQKADRAKEFLDRLPVETRVQVAKAVDTPAEALPPMRFSTARKPSEDLVSPDGARKHSGWLEEADDIMLDLPHLSDVPKVTDEAGKTRLLSEVVDAARNGDKDATAIAENWYVQNYLTKFTQAKAQGKTVDALGRVVSPVAPKPEQEGTILNALGAFQNEIANNRVQVESVLGPDLVNLLGKSASGEEFDNAVSGLKGVLDEGINLAENQSIAPPVKSLLDHIRGGEGAAGEVTPQSALASNPKVTMEEALNRINEGGEPEATKLAAGAIKHTVNEDIVKPQQPGEFGYATKHGAKRTSDTYGEGRGRHLREANIYFQWTAVKHVTEQVLKDMKGREIYGYPRAQEVFDRTMPAIRLYERRMDQLGVPFTMGEGDAKIALSYSQVVDIMAHHHPKDTLLAVANGTTFVPPTNLMEAAAAAARGAGPDDIAGILKQTTTKYMSKGGQEVKYRNPLVDGGGQIGRAKISPEDLTNRVTRILAAAGDDLSAQVSRNAKALLKRRAEETMEMTGETIKSLEDLFANKRTVGEMLDGLADTSTRVLKAGEEHEALQSSIEAANVAAKAIIPSDDMRHAAAAVKVVKRQSKINTKDGYEWARQNNNAVIQQKFNDDANELARTAGPDEKADLGSVHQMDIGNGFVSAIAPIFSRAYGNGDLHAALVRDEALWHTVMSQGTATLNKISRENSKAEIKSALSMLKDGTEAADLKTQTLLTDLQTMTGQILGAPGRTGMMDAAVFRENINIDHLNTMLTRKGIVDQYDLEEAARRAKTYGTNVGQEAAKQVWQWDSFNKDPMQFLNRMWTATGSVILHQKIANDLWKTIEDFGAVSAKPREGFVRVTAKGNTTLGHYIPKDKYISQEAFNQLSVVDSLLSDFSKHQNNRFLNSLQTITDMWKYGVTVINPVHHIKNGIGDISLTYAAEGVASPLHYRNGIRILSTHKNYDGWDAVAALEGSKIEKTTGTSVLHSGSLGKATVDDMYDAMNRRGNLGSYRVLELMDSDAENNGASALGKFWNKFQGTKPAKGIAHVSEARDHWTRASHFDIIVAKNINNTKRFKSMDELYDYASDRVRKWHPDGSDMTKSERTLRQIMPFYSWTRKSMPLIVESMLTNPARFTSVPKAQFAVASAAGVNPDAISEPFPEDQMFPSYLTQTTKGPVAKIFGHYYGIDPGFVLQQTVNQTMSESPLGTLLDMVHPAIKGPFEFNAMKSVAGPTIHDKSDYIDAQIPIINTLSRLTGRSFTGTLAKDFNGQAFKDIQNNQDPTDKAYNLQDVHSNGQGGTYANKTQGEQSVPAILNYLLGLGITDESAKNVVGYAQQEAKKRAYGGK